MTRFRNVFFAAFLGLAVAQVTGAEAARLGGVRSLSTTEYGYRIVDSPTRAGRHAQRFEVRPGDCGSDRFWSDCANDRERSEFVPDRRWTYGTDQWIGFSVYLPKTFRTSDHVNTTVGQIHQRGGPTGVAGGLKSFPPLMQMEMRGDRYTANIHVLTGSATDVRDRVHKIDLGRISEMRGKWVDLVIHFDTSDGNQLLDVYKNGRLKGRFSNWIKFRPKDYYFKYGLYRSFVSKHPGPMPAQVLFIDEVRMGPTRSSVEVDEKRPVD